MEIKIKKLRETATIPTRGSSQAAGYDLYADLAEPVVIKPHSCVRIGTGLAVDIPDGYFGAVFARSGLAAKQNLRPSNCVGVCDSDYRGELKLIVENPSRGVIKIPKGIRIAQCLIEKNIPVKFTEVEELSETKRGTGGLGSTGEA